VPPEAVVHRSPEISRGAGPTELRSRSGALVRERLTLLAFRNLHAGGETWIRRRRRGRGRRHRTSAATAAARGQR
jgi:hypothetical protein